MCEWRDLNYLWSCGILPLYGAFGLGFILALLTIRPLKELYAVGSDSDRIALYSLSVRVLIATDTPADAREKTFTKIFLTVHCLASEYGHTYEIGAILAGKRVVNGDSEVTDRPFILRVTDFRIFSQATYKVYGIHRICSFLPFGNVNAHNQNGQNLIFGYSYSVKVPFP
jgi:hypothetical protein